MNTPQLTLFLFLHNLPRFGPDDGFHDPCRTVNWLCSSKSYPTERVRDNDSFSQSDVRGSRTVPVISDTENGESAGPILVLLIGINLSLSSFLPTLPIRLYSHPSHFHNYLLPPPAM